MKKFLCIILAMVMVFSFAACGEESAEKAADNALKAVKTLNIKGIQKYFGEVSAEDMNLDDISAEEIKIVKKITSKLSWEILGSVEEGEKATVTVNLTTIDFAPILQELFSELLGGAMGSLFGGEQLSEDEMTEKALELIDEMVSKKDAAMVTNKLELDMIKTEDGWKVLAKESLISSFVGGLEDLFEF